MTPNDFRKRKQADGRSKYLRKDDIFMSRDRSSFRENTRQPQQIRQNFNNRTPFSQNIKLKNNYRDEYGDDDYLDDFDNDCDNTEEYSPEVEEEEKRSQSFDTRPSEREYFSKNQNILDDRMINYKKRQLPPLQRYGTNNPRDMYADSQSSSYWSDQDDYRSKRQNRAPSFSSIWQKFIITFTSILSLVCLSWIAYNWNNDKGSQNVASMNNGHILIESEQPSFKVLPDNPGGINVPHQDKTVYERVNPNVRYLESEEKLLPPQEEPKQLPPQPAAPDYSPTTNISANSSSIEECSIVDEKTYSIKVFAGKSKSILESEASLLKKKCANIISGKSCSIRKVNNTKGEQKHAILIGPFDSQDKAISTAQELINVARNLEGQCYAVSVKE